MFALLACSETFESTRYADPNAPRGSESDADTDADADADADADTDADADADTDTDTDADTDADTDTEPLVLTYRDQRVGMFYLTWHTYAAQAWAARGGAPETVDEVIAGNGTFADLVYDAGLYGLAQAFHYHQEPELGFYCLYRQDSDSTVFPTCPNISATARTHASQLWDAGVDFVYVDITNLPAFDEVGDVIGLRPFEVLLEEWGQLRREGVPTPQIAAWVNLTQLPSGSEPMVRRVLAAYAGAQRDVVFAPDGVPAMFYVGIGAVDTALVAEIAAAGVTPVPLWGNLGTDTLAAGTAGWMQPCTTGANFTTLLSPTTACNQWYTTSSPLGTVVSASRSYQVGYASLPFQASGRLDGLTFQKQMETAFAVQPDVLILNAWNEHIAQPQANPYDASYGGLRQSMGVTNVGDATADWLWVDTYGADLNRDFEPTVQDGGAGYDLLRSCLRVYRTGATSCSDGSEACCQLAEGRVMVYAVRSSGSAILGDHVPTVERSEVDSLVAAGWTEGCNPHYAPPGLCQGDGGDGPFGLYASGGSDRVALYRCYSGADHFISGDGACEGRTTERLLGYAAAAPSSAMPRPLTRCYNVSANVHLHWLDATCPSGTTYEFPLGYVQ